MAGRRAEYQSLYTHGFVRAAACAPVTTVADPQANAEAIIALALKADEDKAALAVFPELSVSGYALDDLHLQDALLEGVENAVRSIAKASARLLPVLVVGAPVRVDASVYNCAVVIHRGAVLGVVPKTYLPNYREYYEKRWFASGRKADAWEIDYAGARVPFGVDLIFAASDLEGFVLGVEICEDMWAPIPPSTDAALAGATVLANLSASNALIGKAEDRNVLADAHTRRTVSAYVYAGAGFGESTTDVAWDGHLSIWELGEQLAESPRYELAAAYVSADIDVGRLVSERSRFGTFRDVADVHADRVSGFRRVAFEASPPRKDKVPLKRDVPRFPYVPDDPDRLDEHCFEAYSIQVHGLIKRLKATGIGKAVVGVSGGLDSCQALLVAARAFDRLERPRSDVIAVQMPGFATSDATHANAAKLIEGLGVSGRTIDIKPAAERMLDDLGHPAGAGEPVYDVTYENVQAGLRTDYLFRLANAENGLVVGTGDLSELALGWCTYGVGDHMSHYNVNASVSKTLIQHLIRWCADTDRFGADVAAVLRDILATEISPELVPAGEAGAQRTEDVIGPYALQDFNLYYALRFGFRPSKIAFLAEAAWGDAARGAWPPHVADKDKRAYARADIKKWLEVFVRRFYATSQFKRSAMPNGPKVSTGGALSPRGDWRAPSDASAAVWLAELADNVPE